MFSFGPSYTSASAQVYKLFLLVSMVFVLCPFIAMSRLLHYCLCVSFKLLSKGGCAQCLGAKKDNLQWNLY